MATQVTNVYVKNINDTEWTELEKVFENDVLKFQKSPIKDAYYDYTRVAMVIIAIFDGFYAVQNTSNYTIDVLFTNGAWTTFGPVQAQHCDQQLLRLVGSVSQSEPREDYDLPGNGHQHHAPYVMAIA